MQKTDYRKELLIEFSFLDIDKKRDYSLYRPHLVVQGDSEYLGIAFYADTIKKEGNKYTARIHCIYEGVNYNKLLSNVLFEIREGPIILAKGRVLKEL